MHLICEASDSVTDFTVLSNPIGTQKVFYPKHCSWGIFPVKHEFNMGWLLSTFSYHYRNNIIILDKNLRYLF